MEKTLISQQKNIEKLLESLIDHKNYPLTVDDENGKTLIHITFSLCGEGSEKREVVLHATGAMPDMLIDHYKEERISYFELIFPNFMVDYEKSV